MDFLFRWLIQLLILQLSVRVELFPDRHGCVYVRECQQKEAELVLIFYHYLLQFVSKWRLHILVVIFTEEYKPTILTFFFFCPRPYRDWSILLLYFTTLQLIAYSFEITHGRVKMDIQQQFLRSIKSVAISVARHHNVASMKITHGKCHLRSRWHSYFQ